MTAEKMKRLIVASVASAVALLVVLLAVLVFQMICLVQKNKVIEQYEEEQRRYEEINENTEDEISSWLEKWKIQEAAWELGYRLEDK